MTRLLFAAACAGAIAFAANTAEALPRFAVQTGMKCQSCHVNPSGGGMRKMFGAQFGREDLPVPSWSEGTDFSDVTNLLNNLLGVGADFRTLYLVQKVPGVAGGPATTENSFWQMQGDLYLDFRISKKVHLYLDKGLYSGFEAFGLLEILPENGSIKVGKFLPNYGLKLDDHTAFIRTYTGFSPEAGRPELTGLEAGIAPGPATVTAGLFNATEGFGGSPSSSKAWLVRAEGMFRLGESAVLWLGGNAFGRKGASGITNTLYGGFGALHIGPLSLVAEADFVDSKTNLSTQKGVITYAEAGFTLTQGVEFLASMDSYDPDTDLKTGSVSRFSLGVAFFPLSGVEIRPLYRFMKKENQGGGVAPAANGGANLSSLPENELHVLFHLYL